VDDRTLVEAMTRHDPTGLEGAYRRYVDPLYAYCRALLRDAEVAADVVHDTFLIASQRAGDLREPERLRSWLYAIARNECLRALRTRRRSTPLEEAGEPVAEPVDPTAAVQADQVRDLVRAASAGLSAGDREVIELSVRHGLSAAEVGKVLGVSANNAHARMSRARQQLLRSLGALVVARRGVEHCPTLAGLLHGWDGTLTALVRKRINRHVDSCAVCAARQADELQPSKLLTVYAAMPLLTDARLRAPLDVAGERATDRAAHGPAPAIRLGPDGFPAQPGSRRSLAAAAAAVAVLLIMGTTAVIFARAPTDPVFGAQTGPPGSAAAGPGAGGPQIAPGGGGVTPTTTPGAPTTGGPTQAPPTNGPPTFEPPSTNPPATTMATLIIVSFLAYSDATLTCPGSTGARMTVNVTANKPLFRAMLYWTFPNVDGRQFGAMSRSGTTATRTVNNITRSSVTWWVSLTATDGSRFTSAKVTEDNPCS
jgi:RNA polymerase sigma factor (sigma-70 family)